MECVNGFATCELKVKLISSLAVSLIIPLWRILNCFVVGQGYSEWTTFFSYTVYKLNFNIFVE